MAADNVEANSKEDSTRVHNNQLSNDKRKGSDNNDSKSNSEGGKGNKVGAYNGNEGDSNKDDGDHQGDDGSSNDSKWQQRQHKGTL